MFRQINKYSILKYGWLQLLEPKSRERNMIMYKILSCKTEVERYLDGQEILTFDRSCKVITMLVIVPLDPAISYLYPFFSLNMYFSGYIKENVFSVISIWR
jgi:hypothetical protein